MGNERVSAVQEKKHSHGAACTHHGAHVTNSRVATPGLQGSGAVVLPPPSQSQRVVAGVLPVCCRAASQLRAASQDTSPRPRIHSARTALKSI